MSCGSPWLVGRSEGAGHEGTRKGVQGGVAARRAKRGGQAANPPWLVGRSEGAGHEWKMKGGAVAELLDLEVTDRVGILRLKRSPLNILNQALVAELAAAAVEAGRSPAIGAVVIGGEGRHFSAGADVGEFEAMGVPEVYEYGKLLDAALRGWADLPKVTIAAVNGYALGGGCELALAADFRFASERATLGLPEIQLGIIPGGGVTQRLPRLIGAARAKEMIFTGRHVKAEEALALGLVDPVFPPAELLERAVEAARPYPSVPRVALRAAP